MGVMCITLQCSCGKGICTMYCLACSVRSLNSNCHWLSSPRACSGSKPEPSSCPAAALQLPSCREGSRSAARCGPSQLPCFPRQQCLSFTLIVSVWRLSLRRRQKSLIPPTCSQPPCHRRVSSLSLKLPTSPQAEHSSCQECAQAPAVQGWETRAKQVGRVGRGWGLGLRVRGCTRSQQCVQCRLGSKPYSKSSGFKRTQDTELPPSISHLGENGHSVLLCAFNCIPFSILWKHKEGLELLFNNVIF